MSGTAGQEGKCSFLSVYYVEPAVKDFVVKYMWKTAHSGIAEM